MKTLAELQHTFQECVLHPDAPASTTWISAGGRAAPEVQLSAYTFAYRARLKEVLASDFPAMLVALGEERFDQLADSYIDTHPSHYFSLREFGRHMPGFVADLIGQEKVHEFPWSDMPWLAELALFEWTLGQAFDAADVPLLSEETMATIPPQAWPDLRFQVHPSAHTLELEWNVVEMWQVLTADKPREVTAAREPTMGWLIWRDKLLTRFRSLPPDEHVALEQFRQGECFAVVCDRLATMIDADEVPLRAASLLRSWITQGLIAGIA